MNEASIVVGRHGRGTAPFMLAMLLTLTSTCARAACGINAQGVDFGAYDPLSNEAMHGVGAIVVTCDEGEAYSLGISAGGGTYADRKMTNGRQALHYNLYTDPAHAFVWGDGTGATATSSGVGTGTATSIGVYGRIPARQNISVGTYVDSIVVTMNF